MSFECRVILDTPVLYHLPFSFWWGSASFWSSWMPSNSGPTLGSVFMLNNWLDTLVIVSFPLLSLNLTPKFRSLQLNKTKKTDGHIHWSALGHPSNRRNALIKKFSDDWLRRNTLRKIFYDIFSPASKNTYWGGTVVIVSHCKHASFSCIGHARHYDSMQQASACTSSFIDLSMCI